MSFKDPLIDIKASQVNDEAEGVHADEQYMGGEQERECNFYNNQFYEHTVFPIDSEQIKGLLE